MIVPDATGRKSHRRVKAASNDAQVPLFAPFDAVQARVRDLGQWRQARFYWEKPLFPGFAAYRSPWATQDAASRLCAGHSMCKTGKADRLFSTSH
ncbi:MAG: hypothetical protein FWE88_02310 [Phycisphaerae bacterium]|nr:hypothetical protein [Phycisphaerae bacterium]